MSVPPTLFSLLPSSPLPPPAHVRNTGIWKELDHPHLPAILCLLRATELWKHIHKTSKVDVRNTVSFLSSWGAIQTFFIVMRYRALSLSVSANLVLIPWLSLHVQAYELFAQKLQDAHRQKCVACECSEYRIPNLNKWQGAQHYWNCQGNNN